jgi:hypothetical protein
MGKRYTIKHEPSRGSWFAVEDNHPRCTPPTGFEGYDKTDAQDVADMLNQRTELLAALEEMASEVEDMLRDAGGGSGDKSYYAGVQKRLNKAKAAIAKANGGE